MPPSLATAARLHQQGRFAAAESAYRALLQRDPTDFNALQMLGTVLAQQGRFDDAVTWLQQARARDDSGATVHHNLGNALQSLGRLDEALQSYDRALAIRPDHCDAWLGKGKAHKALQQWDAALACYDRAQGLRPDSPDPHINRGNVLRQLGRDDEALAAYEAALALRPDSPEAAYNRANTLMAQKDWAAALAGFHQALSLRPDYPEALNNLGNTLLGMERHDEAIAAFDRAIALRPDYASAWYNRGNACSGLRRHADALACFDNALRHDPAFAEACNGRGMVMMALQRKDEALLAYEHALALRPDFVEVLHNYGDALMLAKRFPDAAAAFERAMRLDASNKYVQGAAYDCRHHACDWSGHAAAREAIIAGVRAGQPVCSPFVFLSLSDDPADQRTCAGIYAHDRHPPLEPPLCQGERYAHARLRVAYLSADFHTHATAFLMAELFEIHDRDGFEWFAYSFGPEQGGEMRARLERAFDHFHEVGDRSDADIAALLRADEIDIAVDLKGFTLHCRPGIFARRPAPVQVNYLGYPGTMNAPYLDYIIGDRWVTPTAHAPHYREKIVQLPDSYQVNDRHRKIADKVFTRAELGLPERGFVFCCFNNNYKITPDLFTIWMRLLQATPASVLWLLADNPAAMRNLRAEAMQRGVASERLVFAPRMPLPEHLARHRCADLFLDTLPVNAHTTTSDALWAGLPVLTCLGQAFAGRVAASLLSAIELPELITTNLADYEAKALHLAHHPDELHALRAKLAAHRLTTPLFDTERFARNLEAAYREMARAPAADEAASATAPLMVSSVAPVKPPAQATALANRANTLVDLHRHDEALAAYDQALALAPDDAKVRLHRGLELLRLGRWQEGWAAYESRWQVAEILAQHKHRPDTPVWDGRADLAGKTLLVQAEQGFGDTLQFVRFVPPLRTRVGRVVLQVQTSLKSLLENQFEGVTVVGRDEPPPHYDAHCDLLSLAGTLAVTPDTLAGGGPYLQPDPARVAAWAEHLPPRPHGALRVGLAWSGNPQYANDQRRSLPSTVLAPLLAVAGVQWIAVQKQVRDQDDPWLAAESRLVDVSPWLVDFADTAALFANLDLLITVDSSPAHLAGALGLPVWILLPWSADWRWLLTREDTPWYAAARLFRQVDPRDWGHVLTRVTEALQTRTIPAAPGHASLPTGAPQGECAVLAIDVNRALKRAVALQRATRLDDAAALYQAVLAQSPGNFEALHMLGVIAAQQGRFAAAEALLREALTIEVRATALNNLGNALNSLGRREEAIAAYDHALRLDPAYQRAFDNRNNVLRALGRATVPPPSSRDEAAATTMTATATATATNATNATTNAAPAQAGNDAGGDSARDALRRGIALMGSRRFADALAAFDEVIALEPDHAIAHSNRGAALFELGRHDDAAGAAWRATTLDPDFADAWNNLGSCLMKLRRTQEALAAFERACVLRPANAAAHNNRGMALDALNRPAEAALAYARVRELDPAWRGVHSSEIFALRKACLWTLPGDPGRVSRIEAELLDRAAAGAQLAPFVLTALTDDATLLHQVARHYAQTRYPPAAAPQWQGPRYAHARLRVAYLSADFHDHATAYLMAELFEIHDRHHFEWWGVSFGPNKPGTMRARLEKAFDHFLEVGHLSDAEVAQRLRELEIDIAVDLKGYTQDCRPGILGHRPAPIQVNYLGYPGTLGAPHIDFLIGDRWVTPPEHDAFYTEQVVRLPDSYQVNDRHRVIADKVFTRAELGLPEKGFVFCCFNNNYKITPHIFDIWMRLLKKVPRSVLWLLESNGESAANLRREAKARGIAAKRLVFAPKLPLPEHLARHRCADLFLDTLPVNAHTTTSDALWAGLPVLTCLGQAFAGRVAASLLSAIELPELITTNLADYEAKALHLAHHPDELHALRAKLAAHRLTTPLFDTERFARNLEAAYQRMHAHFPGQPNADHA